MVISDRIRRYVEIMKFEENRSITISIGVSSFSSNDRTFSKEDLIRTADEALYRAKTAGRNRAAV